MSAGQEVSPQGPVRPESLSALGEVVDMISRRPWVFLLCPLLCVLAAVALTLLEKRVYESSASLFIRPPTRTTNLGPPEAALSALGGLGGSDTHKNYLNTLLSSNSLRLQVAKVCELETSAAFWANSSGDPALRDQDELLKHLNNLVTISYKEGLESIKVKTTDAALSAKIAKSFLDQLNEAVLRDQAHASSELSSQWKKSLLELKQAENELKKFLQRTKSLPREEQTDQLVKAQVEMEKMLALQEAELAGIKSQIDSAGNISSLVALKTKEASISGGAEALRRILSDRRKAMLDLPATMLEYADLTRELKIKERVVGVVAEQYHLALFRAREGQLPFKIIDRPTVATKPVSRMGLIKVSAGFCIGILLAMLVVQLLDVKASRQVRLRANAG